MQNKTHFYGDLRLLPVHSSNKRVVVSFSILHNAYIVHEMYLEVTACIKWVIITESHYAHTQIRPPLSTRSLARAADGAWSRRPVVCLTIDAAWGFSLDVIGKDARGAFTLQLLMLLRRLAGVSFQTHAVNDLSPYRRTFWRVFGDEGDAAVLCSRSASVQMRVQLSRKMDHNTVDENGPARL